MKSNETKPVGTSKFNVRCCLLNVAVFATATSALAEVHYVDVNSTNATPPYTNWSTAATNIQDAVDAAVAGDEVVVTNGTYNSVVVGKPLNVRSVSGPQFTMIYGGGPCAYLTNNASVSGFTLTGGSAGFGGGAYGGTLNDCTLTGNSVFNGQGGGAYRCTLNNCTLTGNTSEATFAFKKVYGGGAAYCTLNNCTLANNFVNNNAEADGLGGGAYDCTLNNCTLTGNHAYASSGIASGGGAYGCTLYNCTLSGNFAGGYTGGGGGASHSTLNNCMVTSNFTSAGSSGGGTDLSTLTNCTLAGNWGRQAGAVGCWLYNCTLTGNWPGNNSRSPGHIYGGAAHSCRLYNCTLTGNTAIQLGGSYAGGANTCWLYNCIVYFNSPGNLASSFFTADCCTTPLPYGIGNITNAPLFVDTNDWSNLRLQPDSPCINAGNNSYVTNVTDLDGNPRIAGGTVDIGAYEFQSPASMISYAWLQQFNLPISPSTDTADADGDGVDNYHEWLAGTDPTNPFSSPAQLTITPSRTNVVLTWPTNAVGFTLQSTTNLVSPAVWSTNFPAPVVIAGQNTVTNPITGTQQFYRLVQ